MIKNKPRYLRVRQAGALRLLGPVDAAAHRAFYSAQAWQFFAECQTESEYVGREEARSRRDAAVEAWQLLRTVYSALERAAGLA